MSVTFLSIGDCFNGSGRAYIYILFSKKFNLAYIGETNDRNGVLGRLIGHVNKTGTFRKQIFQRRGILLEEISDLVLFAYLLPQESNYTSEEKVYRRGVEYLVQERLREICGDLSPFLYIVSYVQYSDTASFRSTSKIATLISENFIEIYNNKL